ncbi:MAG: methyltransferase domain-containing protein [Dethiobacteria bacterium]|jgi:SAM-dependent methyltransferase|nr:methyltransferase domain-containing protein [Bacillota bacterium]HOP69109.1 methyltransferase domain-containing protein [Bacillota bacterium]HPT33624.1 methyltransferase domain-containing protein [Bacillota bacterium]HPZ64366.1 methyltransferase domain-containing protein [Bacillota bacterium]
MALSWNPQEIQWYEEALRWSNYPQSVLGSILDREIKESDTVLDLGSGIGAIALYVAPFCQLVKAVDSQAKALEILQEKAQNLGLQNVETYLGSWPDVNVERADVTICSYSPPISRSKQGLDKIINVTGRTGIILTPYRNMSENKVLREFASLLGIQSKQSSCDNGCWEKGFLESKNLELQCQLIKHDFSQPVRDYEEAWEFLRNQLDAPAHLKEQALHRIPDYLEEKNGRLLIPIIRESCLIVFKKMSPRGQGDGDFGSP